MSLAEDNLVVLDFSPREISSQLAYLNMKEWSASQKKQRALDKNEYKKLWNGYFDEQKDFFVKTYLFVRDLDRKYFSEAMGFQGEQLTEKLFKKMISIEKAK